ncbi:MAG: hypothetical protein QM761_00750 [Pseudoxanthomonas sp.]
MKSMPSERDGGPLKFGWARMERTSAWILLWTTLFAMAVNVVPDEAFDNRIFVVTAVFVAAVLLLAWLWLMVLHLYRILFHKGGGYSVMQILAVLFVPLFGAALVSLKRTRFAY